MRMYLTPLIDGLRLVGRGECLIDGRCLKLARDLISKLPADIVLHRCLFEIATDLLDWGHSEGGGAEGIDVMTTGTIVL